MRAVGVASPTPRTTPGTTTRVNAPDPNKWTWTATPDGGGRFLCRPLACAEPAYVLAKSGRSPTRDPDEAALQKVARTMLPAGVQGEQLKLDAQTGGNVKLRFVGAKVTRARDFPAIFSEVERRGVGAPDRMFRMDMYIGNNRVMITSVSKSAAVARANLDLFVNAMDIDDVALKPAPAVGVTSRTEIVAGQPRT